MITLSLYWYCKFRMQGSETFRVRLVNKPVSDHIQPIIQSMLYSGVEWAEYSLFTLQSTCMIRPKTPLK